MTLASFLGKQFIRVIEWNEPEPGILVWRYPMMDQEIENGGKLTVRESEMAAFVNEGKIADIFSPGLYTLSTQNLPILTDLMNWSKDFQSPFKSDVYFFSTHLQIDQKWGTANPITIRDQEFGAVRVRAYGIYTFRIADPRTFFTQVVFAASQTNFLDMTANEAALGDKIKAAVAPAFTALGLELAQFVVENVSLPDELQKSLDARIGMNIVGDLDKYSQFAAAQSISTAAANPGGVAGLGVGLGAGAAMGQMMSASLHPAAPPPISTVPATSGPTDLPAAATKFCIACGHSIPGQAVFCPVCGKPQ
jgi:membrane protease subunit (stomatin/prohibitin family)